MVKRIFVFMSALMLTVLFAFPSFAQVYGFLNDGASLLTEEEKRDVLGALEREGERALTIDDVDLMGGVEFESAICSLFKAMGYAVHTTKQPGDQGIDVIAEKSSAKIGIQAKCYASAVGNAAVQEAGAGRVFYGCGKAMVVTNSTFTKSAVELAAANGVILWGRDILMQKLADYPVTS